MDRTVAIGSKLVKFSPLDDDKLLRVRGHLKLSELAYESKHPVILPKCHGSMLIVRHVHHMQKHAGVDAMITFVCTDFKFFGLHKWQRM